MGSMRKWWYVLVLMGLLGYLWPLFQPNEYHAGSTRDPLAHSAQLDWFCEDFFRYEFKTLRFFAPNGVNMAASYDMPLLQALACLVPTDNHVARYNFLAGLQVVLIMVVTGLVASKYVSNRWLVTALVLTYGFGGFTLARMEAHINLLSTVWATPLVFWVFDSLKTNSRRDTILAFAVLGITWLTAWQNIPNLFILVVWLTGAAWWRTRQKESGFNLGLGLLALVLVSAFFMAPMVWSSLAIDPAVLEAGRQEYLYTHNADVLTYILPWEKNWLYSLLPEQLTGTIEFEEFNPIDPVVLVLLFWAVLQIRQKRRNFGQWGLIIVYVVLSFGPAVRVGNQVLVKLPYFYSLQQLPPFTIARIPARLAIVPVFLMTLMAFRWLDRWLGSKGKFWQQVIPIGLVGYGLVNVTVGSGNVAYPHVDYREFLPEAALRKMRADIGNVINVPLATGKNPLQNFLQVYHDKPMLNGYVSYAAQTQESLNYLDNHPVFRRWRCGQLDRVYFQDAAAISEPSAYGDYVAAQLIRDQINYVVVYKDMLEGQGCTTLRELLVERMRDFEGFDLIVENAVLVIYEVLPDGKVNRGVYAGYDRAEFRTDEDGWIWMMGTRGRLWVYANDYGLIELTGRVLPVSGSANMTVTVSANMISQEFEADGAVQMVALPVHPGENEVELTTVDCREVELPETREPDCASVRFSQLDVDLKPVNSE